MAKPPPVEFFNIHIERVPKEQLGETMSALAKLGLTMVRPELVTEVLRYKEKATHDVKASEFLKTWVADHPTFKAKEAVVYFDLHGRTAGAAYTGLRVLVEEGVLKKLGEGNYAIKGMKALAAPKKAKQVKQAKKPVMHEVSHPDYILKHVRRRASFTREDVMHLLKRDKRTPSSVGGTLSTLLKRGDIERTGSAEYKPVMKGNGAATEAAHG